MRYPLANFGFRGTLLPFLTLSMILIFLPACGEKEEEESKKLTAAGVDESDVRTAVPDMGTLLIDLPSSIAASQENTELRLQDNEEGGIENLFLLPRDFIGVADQFSNLIKEVVTHIFGKPTCIDDDASNDPADCATYPGIVRGAIEESPTVFVIPSQSDDEGGPSAIKYYKNPESSEFDYTFELYWQNEADSLYYLGLKLDVTKVSTEKAKGQARFFPTAMPSNDASFGSIIISFDNTAESSTFDLNIYDFDRSSDESQPDRLGLRLSLDANGVLTGSGSIIRPEMSADQGQMVPFESKEEMAYVFNIAADSTTDVAVQNLAFPQGTDFSSTALFESFGVDKTIQNVVINILRNTSENWDCSAYGTLLSLEANICSTNTAVTDAEVINAVETFCQSNPNSDLCAGPLGSSDKWSNPIYLNADGFLGTASHNTPSDEIFTNLREILDGVTVYSPADLKNESAPTASEGLSTLE